jgi:hypothetical protein
VTREEWLAQYESIAHTLSSAAADLDEMFSDAPLEATEDKARCLGLRDDLRALKDEMLRRLHAIEPE